jgi:probable F420-dependent oxidoreductase
MTPFFDPGPIAHPDVPIYIAGVGLYMAGLAGEVCAGFHVHPFHTIGYLDEVVLPAMQAGAARSGRSLDDVERAASLLVVTGRSDEEMQQMRASVKQQISFYASTPAYHDVLERAGYDFGRRLTDMSVRGQWAEMAAIIPDDLVDEVAVVAPLDELGRAIRDRYGDRLQRVGYYTMLGLSLDDDQWAELIAATRG